jgi:hypothetical protein
MNDQVPALRQVATVAALYVHRRGPYSCLPGVDPWDIDRDATTYPGPHPVVAHPPCGHWGKYAHNCKQPGAECAEIALRQVRRWGGVLEHPLGSRLFKTAGIPGPGWDLWGGLTLLVDQCRWGHPARKPTLLYFVGCTPPPIPPDRAPTHELEKLSSKKRAATPPAFAAWLIEAARRAR